MCLSRRRSSVLQVCDFSKLRAVNPFRTLVEPGTVLQKNATFELACVPPKPAVVQGAPKPEKPRFPIDVDCFTRRGQAQRCSMLISCLRDGDAVLRADGTIANAVDLLLDGIRYDPDFSPLYLQLAERIKFDETVTLRDGTQASKAFLLGKSVDDTTSVSTYEALNELMKSNDFVRLANGKEVNAKDLLVMALHHHPNSVRLMFALAQRLDSSEVVHLSGNRVWSRRRLRLEVVNAEPRNSPYVGTLALDMKVDEEVELLDGRTLSQQQLLVRAIQLAWDPKLIDGWIKSLADQLAATLGPGETVTLSAGGPKMAAEDLRAFKAFCKWNELVPSLGSAPPP